MVGLEVLIGRKLVVFLIFKDNKLLRDSEYVRIICIRI